LELDRKAMEIAYKYKQPSRISGNVSVTDESYKPETRNTKKQDSSEGETFTLEANGNHNYQDFHLRDGSLIQCGLYSFGVGDLTLKITSFAPYPVSVSWTLDAPYISPKHGSGNIAAKGQAGIWDDFRMNGENCKFYGVTITVKKLKK
jgi:hypothetical protein